MECYCKKTIYLNKFMAVGAIDQCTIISCTKLPPFWCGSQIVILECSTHEADILRSQRKVSADLKGWISRVPIKMSRRDTDRTNFQSILHNVCSAGCLQELGKF